MSTERGVEMFCLLAFGLCGLSMLISPTAWRRFFQELSSDGPAGSLVLGLMALGAGAFIVSFHRVWHGLMALVTIVGWVHVVEGAIFLLLPSATVHWLAWAGSENRTGLIRLAGLIGVAVAVAIGAILGSLQFGPITP